MLINWNKNGFYRAKKPKVRNLQSTAQLSF